MLTLTDTWQIIAHMVTFTDRRLNRWDYEIGDKHSIAGLRATGLIVTALRREPSGALVMVGKLTPPDIVVPSTVSLRRGNCARS